MLRGGYYRLSININNLFKMKIETLYNPIYNNVTNKIVAYTLPKPIEGINHYEDLLGYWETTEIEISVDNELIEFIEDENKFSLATCTIIDITPIMDRIEISQKCTGCDRDINKPLDKKFLACCPDNNYQYFAKLKQVDKVEVSEAVLFAEWIRKNQYEYSISNRIDCWFKGMTGYKTTQELYEIFKTNK